MAKKKTTRQKRQPGWINKKEIAASIGISVQAFSYWGLQPVAKIGREAFYTVDDVIDYKVKRALEKAGEHGKLVVQEIEKRLSDPNLTLADRFEIRKLQKIELENERLGLQNAVLDGRSLPAWGVTEVLSRILSRAGEIFDGLPLKIKRKHPGIDKRVIEMLKAEIVKAQNEVDRLDDYSEEIIDEVVSEAEERIR